VLPDGSLIASEEIQASDLGRPALTVTQDDAFAPMICDKAFSDNVWDAFNFDKEDWDNGRGYDDFCDVDRMLGLTYIGIAVALFSSPTPPKDWDDISGNALHWAAPFASNQIDELDGVCNFDPDLALTHVKWGLSLDDEWTRLFKGFAYREQPVRRAATLVHEARHASLGSDNEHNGNSGTPICAEMSRGCDDVFSNDAKSSDARANSYEVYYLSWYVAEAVNTTPYQVDVARNYGNFVLNFRFDNPPGWNIL